MSAIHNERREVHKCRSFVKIHDILQIKVQFKIKFIYLATSLKERIEYYFDKFDIHIRIDDIITVTTTFIHSLVNLIS